MSSSSLGKRAATSTPTAEAGKPRPAKIGRIPPMHRASAVTRPVSPPHTPPSGFVDAQGGVAILLMASDHDSSAWYIVPYDVFCKDLQPIANKFHPDNAEKTKDMLHYLAGIDHLYPYELCDDEEEDEDCESSDDDKDEEKKVPETKVATKSTPKWDEEEARQRESAELYALFEGLYDVDAAKWAKYRVSNTTAGRVTNTNPGKMWASDVRITNAKCVFCMYADEM